jgi:glycosyltransferase involved in cell wall biosynthesis
MHISLFLSGLSGGGAQRRLLTLARGFVERDHQVDVVVGNDDGPFRNDVPAAARLVCLGRRWTQWPLLRHRRGLWVPALMPALARFLAGERPEAVLATSTPANLTALGARAMAGNATAVVVSVNVHLSGSTVGAHSPYGPIVRRLVARAYPRAAAIVAISPDIAADLAATAGVAQHRIAVIDNPVDREGIERAAAAPVEHPWLQPGQPPVVLAVGKLKRQKDLPTLIQAFARVLHQRPVRLIVLGEGEERARLQAMVTRMGLADAVSMPGFVANPYCWMARAAVFVLSSAWEGLSNALLEALACGCPVVSTDCPSGPRHVLANGAFGPLVPVGDDVAMGEAILSLLAAPPAPQRLRDRVRAFSLDRSVERYLEVLSAASARCGSEKAIPLMPGSELTEP